jgi:hypothetical protein
VDAPHADRSPVPRGIGLQFMQATIQPEQKMKPTKTTTLCLRKSINRSPLQHGLLLIPLALALACFGLSPMAQAVSPPPDGGYPNNNTAEGDYALFNLTYGVANTANGYEALFSNTTGTKNSANGDRALLSYTTGN